MSKFRNSRLTSPPIVFLLIAIGFLTALFFNNRAERNSQLQELVSDLQEEISNSESSLEEDQFLSLKKDVATLKKESFAFEEARLLTTVQIISGLAVFGGFFLTWHSQEIEREKNAQDFETSKEKQKAEWDKNAQDTKIVNERLINERFFNAIELLGNDNSEARLGGVYTLENIAKDSLANASGYKEKVIRVLTAFIKGRSPWLGQKAIEKNQEENNPTALDIKIALEVIHSLWKELPPNSETLNLSNIKLEQLLLAFMDCWKHLHIESSYLNDVDFTTSDLSDSRFTDCILVGVVFKTSILCSTSFKGATLKNVEFTGADLKSAIFANATFENVNFSRTDLKYARFEGADFKEVDFTDAENLESANFEEVNLENVSFESSIEGEKFTSTPLDPKYPDAICRTTLRKVVFKAAILKKVNFRDVDFEKVNFTNADLENADFTGAVLKEVDFTGVKNIESVDFTGVNLENTKGLDLEKVKSSPEKTVEENCGN